LTSSNSNSGTSLAIEKALTFLYENQLPSGEILCYWSDDKDMRANLNQDSSPFPTALLAFSLSFIEDVEAKKIVARACTYLKLQMEAGGVWRYWTAAHPYYKYIPVDLDDTACASIVLKQNQIEFADNSAIFTSNESQKGFYTWIVPRLKDLGRYHADFWKVVLKQNLFNRHMFFKMHEAATTVDIDGVVNANAAYYLGRYHAAVDIKNALAYLTSIINSETEAQCDKWHLSKFNFYYSFSRLYWAAISSDEGARKSVIERILATAQSDGRFGETALDTALGACALLNYGQPCNELDRAIAYLLLAQSEEGSWPASIFYFGGPQYGGPEKYYGWGSKELTTGFCLEALSRAL
jgi:hypothetical protein